MFYFRIYFFGKFSQIHFPISFSVSLSISICGNQKTNKDANSVLSDFSRELKSLQRFSQIGFTYLVGAKGEKKLRSGVRQLREKKKNNVRYMLRVYNATTRKRSVNCTQNRKFSINQILFN